MPKLAKSVTDTELKNTRTSYDGGQFIWTNCKLVQRQVTCLTLHAAAPNYAYQSENGHN
jgi:hypothetical protein